MATFFQKGATKLLQKIIDAPEFVVISQGGQSSGKTWAALQWCILMAIKNSNVTVTVVGHSVPHMNRGVIRDMKKIFELDPHLKAYYIRYNENKRQYRFHNGSVIEFNVYEDEMSARGAKRQYLFINEANGIGYAVYKQLADRTDVKVVLDFNPTSEFWAHTEVWRPIRMKDGEAVLDEEGKVIRETQYMIDKFGKRVVKDVLVRRESDGTAVYEQREVKNAVLFKTNWRHNQSFLSPQVISSIERYKDLDPEHYKVYGLGEIGKIEGLVYKRAKLVSSIPDTALEQVWGMDFGFSDDPTTLIRCCIDRVENKIYLEEKIYGTGIGVDKLAELVFRYTGNNFFVFSDVNPQMIFELNSRGCNLLPAKKPPGSILAGINTLQSFDEILCLNNSPNLWKELQNYKYGKDKNEKNEVMPIDAHNHALDAARYAVSSRARQIMHKVFEFSLGGYS